MNKIQIYAVFSLLTSPTLFSQALDATEGIGFGAPNADLYIGKAIGEDDLNVHLPSGDNALNIFTDGAYPTFKAGEGHEAKVTGGKWYRIAKTNGPGAQRTNATFTLRDQIPGCNQTMVFQAGISYSNHWTMGVTLLSNNYHFRIAFPKVRIVDSTKWNYTQPSYLEVFVEKDGDVRYSIGDNLGAGGWIPVDWLEVGEAVGWSYTAYDFDVANKQFMVGDYKSRFSVSRGGKVEVDGSLAVNGSPVLTESAASNFLDRGSVRGGGLLGVGVGSDTNGHNAIAVGDGAKAIGGAALAIGPGAEAISGDWGAAVALGSNTKAAPGGAALGSNSRAGQSAFAAVGGVANGFRSIAIGDGSETGGNWTTAIGQSAKVFSVRGTALGESVTVDKSGLHAVVIGYKSGSSAPYSFVAGSYATAEEGANHSFVAGLGAVARDGGQHSFVLAQGGVSAYPNEIVIGAFNKPIPELVRTQLRPIFTVGNGDNHGNRSNAIEVSRNGRALLRNRYWDSEEPLKEQESIPFANGGAALVVEGHTIMKGKVTIQPQGDISMGVFK